MARNPFEQLQDVVVEPRQAFEDVVAILLKCLSPSSRRVRVYRGDGGIDSFEGTLGDGGEADVFQIKYFPKVWGDPQKQQIRDAFQTARNSTDYKLRKWTLCVPVRLTKEDLRWFDEWRSKQESEIDLLDGDDLTTYLAEDRCSKARDKLREWDIVGVQGGGPVLQATALVDRKSPEKDGLTAVVYIRIENQGDRSAKVVKATVSHDQTGCVAYRQHDDWQQAPNDPSINPRMLRYRHPLNPGEKSVIMGVPLCERSGMPFRVSIMLTAEDCQPIDLHCQITSEHIATTTPVPFGTTPFPSQLQSLSVQPSRPTSPAAKEILELILAHPVRGERGLTEILGDSPHSALEACFIPNTTAAGSAPSIKKSLLRGALAELVQLGWLLPPEGEGRVRIYELNPEAGV